MFAKFKMDRSFIRLAGGCAVGWGCPRSPLEFEIIGHTQTKAQTVLFSTILFGSTDTRTECDYFDVATP